MLLFTEESQCGACAEKSNSTQIWFFGLSNSPLFLKKKERVKFREFRWFGKKTVSGDSGDSGQRWILRTQVIYYSIQIAFMAVTLHPSLHDCRTYRKFKMILFFSIQCELLIDSLY